MELICCLALKYDALACNYLIPLARHPLVSKLWIVRHKKPEVAEIPKSEYRLAPERCKWLRWAHMYRECRALARRPEVAGVVSFNPVPYGLIAHQAAYPLGKKTHFGFIGSDWYRACQGPLRSVLLPCLRRGDFFTATGEAMKNEMVQAGFPAGRIAVLPHAVDVERLGVSDATQMKYRAIFVGQLIERKRVDILLRAYALTLKRFPGERFCIVGDGPLGPRLEQLAVELGLRGHVDFIGAAPDPAVYMRQAEVVTMASDMEGFPFALVEGLCVGLVPVSTAVGTIAELIRDGENGFLIPQNDPEALSDRLCRLIEDRGLYARMRAAAAQMRAMFSYDRATAVWDSWLCSLQSN
ncbi:MAG: glycosyltransferase [Spartobacteria bacterium]|nr:glycosyltransferase [Spartobacteria bacterium]